MSYENSDKCHIAFTPDIAYNLVNEVAKQDLGQAPQDKILFLEAGMDYDCDYDYEWGSDDYNTYEENEVFLDGVIDRQLDEASLWEQGVCPECQAFVDGSVCPECGYEYLD
jgi:hypothetical protein